MEITTTVSFDVGGTVYKVAHSLLERHPNTIMAKMVAENLQQDQDTKKKDAEVLFLEGDGGRFKYVLDYMRGGKIFLPAMGVSKDAILSDLDYYGFTNVSSNDVKVACLVNEPVKRPTTVYFDVGGTVYRVAHSLLEQHPNTIMAKMVFENWQQDQDTEKQNAEFFFLEGDGGRFKYVLDYMRGGKIFLPGMGVSKDAILSDLDYYGFTNVSLNDVQVPCLVQDSINYLLSVEKEYAERKKLHDEKEIKVVSKLNNHGMFLELAFFVYGKVKQNGQLTFEMNNGEMYTSQRKLYEWLRRLEEPMALLDCEEFNECLAVYQLKFVKAEYDGRWGGFRLSFETLSG